MKLSDKYRWYADMIDKHGHIELYIDMHGKEDFGSMYNSGIEECTHFETGGGLYGKIPDTYDPKNLH